MQGLVKMRMQYGPISWRGGLPQLNPWTRPPNLKSAGGPSKRSLRWKLLFVIVCLVLGSVIPIETTPCGCSIIPPLPVEIGELGLADFGGLSDGAARLVKTLP